MTADQIRESLKGYKITYLAEQTGLHYNTIHRFMSGSDPRLSTATRLAQFLEERGQGAKKQ